MDVGCRTSTCGRAAALLPTLLLAAACGGEDESLLRLDSSRGVTWSGVVEGPTVRAAVFVGDASVDTVELRFRTE